MYPLVMTNIAKGNGPFIDGLHLKNGVFSMAMLNNQMVYIYIYICVHLGKNNNHSLMNGWLTMNVVGMVYGYEFNIIQP